VCHGLGKVGIVLRGEPTNKIAAPVAFLGKAFRVSKEILCRNDIPALGMLDVAFFFVSLDVDDFFLAIDSFLDTDGRKEGSHLVIMILGPLFKRMIVALSTTHPN